MSNQISKRKVLVPIFNRAHYGRLRPVLKAIQNNPDLELQVMVAYPASYGYFWKNIRHSHPHSWGKAMKSYIRARLVSLLSVFDRNLILKNNFLASAILADGFSVDSKLSIFFDGGTSETMAKSMGLGFSEMINELKRLKPDVVFVNADRFEMMAVAMAAAALNIPIVHNEGGDISGTIDESIRHAITKLAHIHFVSTEASRKRVLQMGENPDFVFTTGSPAIDAVKNVDFEKVNLQIAGFDPQKPFLLALVHSVATEDSNYNENLVRSVISAIKKFNLPVVFVGSNIDAGSADLAKVTLPWKAERPEQVLFEKNLTPNNFYFLLSKTVCAIGNSSSFIREGAFLGTPAVLVGSRQNNRERSDNAKEVLPEVSAIEDAIKKQIEHGRYESTTMFGDGNSASRIANILASAKPSLQKEFKTL